MPICLCLRPNPPYIPFPLAAWNVPLPCEGAQVDAAAFHPRPVCQIPSQLFGINDWINSITKPKRP